eukprot:gnl/Hemi2/23027_TR7710_c0_g1_i1.p1 gnl/Hemi2/23027_TR7710_c0_g1~~gnl/Hemi2/23027_TR7710_c0_g1_i1.p1  ORF type:complete len:780 (+),score=147.86 gnl/Hemi2/23027_TR7710_c0_g1_i1:118-2457(+)
MAELDRVLLMASAASRQTVQGRQSLGAFPMDLERNFENGGSTTTQNSANFSHHHHHHSYNHNHSTASTSTHHQQSNNHRASSGPAVTQPHPAAVSTPMCSCMQPSVQRLVSKDNGNKGRPFFVCGSNVCRFFEWADGKPSAPVPGQPAREPGAMSRQHQKPGVIDFELISPERFTASNCARSDVLAIYKKHSGTPSGHCWWFPVSAFEAVTSALKTLAQLTLVDPPLTVVRKVRTAIPPETTQAARDKMTQGIPSGLLAGLYPFQEEGVRFAIERQGRVLIGDEMGLGKTVQAIAVACVYRTEWPLLVISPSSVRLNWMDELRKWIPDLTDYSINVVNGGKGNTDALINIISYDLVPRLFESILSYKFQVIICDESHYLKNPKAQRTTKIMPLLQQARRVVLLTGTPALSRPIELYNQIHVVDHSVFPNMKLFGNRYCDGKRGRFGVDFTGASHLTELNVILTKTVLVRRLKKDVLTQLPPKRRQQVHIAIDYKDSLDLKKMFKQMMEYSCVLQNSRNEDEIAKTQNKRRALMHNMFQVTGDAKIEAVLEYIDMVRENGVRFLVFSHHQVVLHAIDKHLEKHGVNHITIDGSTAHQRRHALVYQYMNDESYQIANLSILAAGTGLTLTAADTVIFSELFWNPGILVQAEDRAHRIGQLNSVNVYYLLAKGTLDDVMWPLIQKKLDIVDTTLNGAKSNIFQNQPAPARASLPEPTLLDYFGEAAHGAPGQSEEEESFMKFFSPENGKDDADDDDLMQSQKSRPRPNGKLPLQKRCKIEDG